MNSRCKWLTPHFTISIINNIPTNLVSQSRTTKIDYSQLKSTISTFGQGWISVPFHCAAQCSTPAVLRLWPPTEVVCLLTVLCSVYIIIWLSLVSVYNNQRSISLDYPGQDRLPNWLSGAPQPQCFRRLHACTPSYRIRRADSVASSHSAPLRVLYCIYSESGLFWAISWLSITIYPFHTQCGALSIPLSSIISLSFGFPTFPFQVSFYVSFFSFLFVPVPESELPALISIPL